MLPAAIQARRAAEAHLNARVGINATENYPTYTWPMQDALHDTVHIVNYVDEDPSAGLLDYNNGDWTYDTHRGTDIALTDFRSMDRGMRIVSAAPGTVTYAVYANRRDRNCDFPDDPTLNYLEVANGDGTYTYYYHLRANSMTVNVGETVQRGEVLGLAGSSGYSYGPHLHFEAADFSAGYTPRDPWAGPANPNPGLWQQQAPWEGAQHLLIYDMGLTTQTAAGGDLGTVDYCAYFAEHMQQPAVFGIHEPWIPIWFYPQGLAGDAYRLEIRRPNSTMYTAINDTLTSEVFGGYYYWYWSWNGFVSAADYGTWSAVLLISGVPVRTISFVVGPNTIYGPRFRPAVSRSFRIDGTSQRDTLRVTALSGAVNYALINAPATVSLVDSIVTVGPASSQPTRSAYFQAIATDGAARRDTAWFHIVDPSKSQEPVLDAGVRGPLSTLGLAAARPNPFSGPTEIGFALPRTARMTLSIVDVRGRRVRTLLDGVQQAGSGGELVVWNGGDDRGRPVPAGVYFCVLSSGGERLIRRLVRLK